MADPKEALKVLEEYYATVTPEQFWEDWQRARPKGPSLHEEWVAAGIEKKDGSPTKREGGSSGVQVAGRVTQKILQQEEAVLQQQEALLGEWFRLGHRFFEGQLALVRMSFGLTENAPDQTSSADVASKSSEVKPDETGGDVPTQRAHRGRRR